MINITIQNCSSLSCCKAGNSGSIAPAAGNFGVYPSITIQQRTFEDTLSSQITIEESLRPPKEAEKGRNDEDVQRLRSDVCHLVQELEAARRLLDSMSTKFEEYAEETNGLKKNVIAQQETIQQLEKKNEENERQLELANQNMMTLQEQISSQNKVRESLEFEAIMRDRKIDSLENMFTEQGTRIDELEADKQMMEVQIEEIQVDKDLEVQSLREEIESLREIIRGLEEERPKCEFDSLRSDTTQYETEIEESLVSWMETTSLHDIPAHLGTEMEESLVSGMETTSLHDIPAHLAESETEQIHECPCQDVHVLPTGLPDETVVVPSLRQEEKEAIPTLKEEKTSPVPQLVPEVIPTLEDYIPATQSEASKDDPIKTSRDTTTAPDEEPLDRSLNSQTSAVELPEQQFASPRLAFSMEKQKF
ncbi:coiled-coil domain-containing protein 186-like [Macrobrachium nipponense]|uniref:coiled-coil domain-containing protein 186-like n=1 Tax=Macrobrachium nipponense TaxID=159736 RepID=UPI0030C7B30C